MNENRSFGGVIKSNCIYKIPNYQRDYAWKKENFDDLWGDLKESIEQESKDSRGHFLGTIVLAKRDNTGELFDVIDGQQRLTTAFMLLVALIAKSKDEFIEEEKHYLYKRGEYKLKVAEENRAFFKKLLDCANKNEPSESLRDEANTAGKKNLFEVFRRILDEVQKLSPQDIDKYIKALNNMQMIDFVEESTGRAIRTFQSVNDRGVDLQLLDKLKALLIYYSNVYCDGEDSGLDDEINEKFGAIFKCSTLIQAHDRFGSMPFPTQSKEFEANMFRYHIGSSTDEVIKIRRDYKDSNEVSYKNLKARLEELKNDKEALKGFLQSYTSDFKAFFYATYEILEEIEKSAAMFKCMVLEKMKIFLYGTFVRLKIDNKLDDEMIALFAKADFALLKCNNAESTAFALIEKYKSKDLEGLKKEILRVCKYKTIELKDRIERFINNPFQKHSQSFHYIFIEHRCKDIEIDTLKSLPPLDIDHIIKHSYTNDLEIDMRAKEFGFDDAMDFGNYINHYGNLLSLEQKPNRGEDRDKPPYARDGYKDSKLAYNRQFPTDEANKEGIIKRDNEVRAFFEEFFKDFL